MPIIEPSDRSNSPAIMSSATGAPRMPTWAAIWSQPATPMGPRNPFLPARMAKMMNTRTAPMRAPISGLANRRRSGPSERRRLGAAPVAWVILGGPPNGTRPVVATTTGLGSALPSGWYPRWR